MIPNNTIKAEKPDINFYYEDIITHLKKQNTMLGLPKDSRKIYKQIIQNEYKHYIKTGQSHWNQYGKNYGKKPSTHTIGPKITTYSTYSYIINDIL